MSLGWFKNVINKIFTTHILGAFNKFPDFFCTGIKNCHRLLGIQYLIAIHLMR